MSARTFATVPAGLVTPCCSLPPVDAYRESEMGTSRYGPSEYDLVVKCRCQLWWAIPNVTVEAAREGRYVQKTLAEVA